MSLIFGKKKEKKKNDVRKNKLRKMVKKFVGGDGSDFWYKKPKTKGKGVSTLPGSPSEKKGGSSKKK